MLIICITFGINNNILLYCFYEICSHHTSYYRYSEIITIKQNTHHSIRSHIEHQQLGRADRLECLYAVHDSAVQHPQPITPVCPHPKHGYQAGTVGRRRRQYIAAGRFAVPFPVRISLRKNNIIQLSKYHMEIRSNTINEQ